MKDLTLNQLEQTRLHVLNTVLEHQLPVAQAAELLGVSERHAWRLLAAYRREGAAALAHGDRGRRPRNTVSDHEANAVIQLASTTYAGPNHTHLSELLREREGIDLSRQSAQSRQGIGGLVLPGPVLGTVQGELECLAGDASRQGEEGTSKGLVSRELLLIPSACRLTHLFGGLGLTRTFRASALRQTKKWGRPFNGRLPKVSTT